MFKMVRSVDYRVSRSQEGLECKKGDDDDQAAGAATTRS
jgi:hypothetical protein